MRSDLLVPIPPFFPFLSPYLLPLRAHHPSSFLFLLLTLILGSSSLLGVLREPPRDDDAVAVKLMRCVVIECCKPVFALTVSSRRLILGEANVVRIINLRGLGKGNLRIVKQWVSKEKLLHLPNSVIRDGDGFGGSISDC
ncbi:hypothetical protein SLEP1_g10678 [Rubroshorea leprosula]|uniref:Uncharacterized protein n=1 Tax=Rubroshorea leprosula TaxID=152421 RepID=A0AAV5I8T3_9ROSI|nr:hypothetical protein SLEP1_g10678 [Rubroshorea leprosula]